MWGAQLQSKFELKYAESKKSYKGPFFIDIKTCEQREVLKCFKRGLKWMNAHLWLMSIKNEPESNQRNWKYGISKVVLRATCQPGHLLRPTNGATKVWISWPASPSTVCRPRPELRPPSGRFRTSWPSHVTSNWATRGTSGICLNPSWQLKAGWGCESFIILNFCISLK